MRAKGFAVLGAIALMTTLPGAARAADACKPIAGAEQVLQKADLRWLVVGEIHGTAELPAAFGDLVCLAAARGKSVTVGLEYPPSEQARLDAYMASAGNAADRAELLNGAAWRQTMRDGRSSQAMLALVERLRAMKAAGQVARVSAVRKELQLGLGQNYDPAAAEAAIGEGMREAGSTNGLTLILIGNVHAATRRFRNMTYDPAASSLPPDKTITLNFDYAGGTAWTCQRLVEGGEVKCQGNSAGQPREPGERRIALSGPEGMPWSGIFSLGAQITASPPAVPEVAVTAPRE